MKDSRQRRQAEISKLVLELALSVEAITLFSRLGWKTKVVGPFLSGKNYFLRVVISPINPFSSRMPRDVMVAPGENTDLSVARILQEML